MLDTINIEHDLIPRIVFISMRGILGGNGMDYVKQMDTLRKRNIELVKENEELRNELQILKDTAISPDDGDKGDKGKEEFEKIKQTLINTLEKYKEIINELENIKIDYQIKLRELSDTLLATRDFIGEREDDDILKRRMSEVDR